MAAAKKITLVASSGNMFLDLHAIKKADPSCQVLPVQLPRVIGVSSVGYTKLLTWFSDYGFGVANPPALSRILSANKRPLLSTLDSRYRLTDYKRAGLHSATPNEGEIEVLHHTSIGKNLAELERCGRVTLEQMNLDSLVITRGRDGVALFQPGMETVHIPIHGSDQAVDVTGAGDTVLAAYTLGLASGATPLEAAHLANIAGGLVVMKRGTATVSRAELLEAIGSSASGKTS